MRRLKSLFDQHHLPLTNPRLRAVCPAFPDFSGTQRGVGIELHLIAIEMLMYLAAISGSFYEDIERLFFDGEYGACRLLNICDLDGDFLIK